MGYVDVRGVSDRIFSQETVAVNTNMHVVFHMIIVCNAAGPATRVANVFFRPAGIYFIFDERFVISGFIFSALHPHPQGSFPHPASPASQLSKPYHFYRHGHDDYPKFIFLPGDYFGEIALLQGSPRKASVYATSPKTTCFMIDEPSFRRLLGPIREILKRKITLYQAYDDFIDDSNPATAGAAGPGKKEKAIKTMRKKKQEETQVKQSRKIVRKAVRHFFFPA